MRRTTPLASLALLLTYASALTAEDNVPPPGFKPLFNGKDLTGWQAFIRPPKRARLSLDELAKLQRQLDARILPHWTVRDGVLCYDGKGNSIQTVEDYGYFELLLDWKIMKHGDSGIYLRGIPQVQIWDPHAGPQSAVGSGGLFNNKKHASKPLVCADNPIGQWNTFRIIMKGDKVTVYLNGKPVVDNVPLENYWDRTRPLPKQGPIVLQHHGSPLFFKNIFIKEL